MPPNDSAPPAHPARGPTLRLVCVNDVYSLENLPRLATLVRAMSAAGTGEDGSGPVPDLTLVTLAGDFLAPSMLSSLDKGRGMVDCLNAVPVTHVTFGNHEDDVDVDELRQRVREFRGTWLNTNVRGFVPELPRHQVVEVGGGDGTGVRRVRVGLLGVVMRDPTVYRRVPFGAQEVDSANEDALRETAVLMREFGCACVVPLTHQPVDDDRALARLQREPPFPVISGGHEHTVFFEQTQGTWIVKAGCDAVRAAVVDLTWPAEGPVSGAGFDLPSVRARMIPVAEYAEDPALRARVDQHMTAVRELEGAVLMYLPEGQVLSSAGARARQTSVGTLLCSLVRDAQRADACVINGGGVRAGRDYHGRFTYGDLKAEVPFDNSVVVVQLPGRVLREAVASSRAKAPAESGAFLQVDDGVTVADDGRTVTAVGGEPLDESRDYRVAMVWNLLAGMDHIEPLERFAREHPERVPDAESGREIKIVLVDAFSAALWRRLGTFDEIDTDHSGEVTAAEIAAAIKRVTLESPSAMAVELLLRSLDANRDNVISRAESDEVTRNGRPPGGPAR